MISIVYAYPLEVKALKKLLTENDFQSKVNWHKWPSLPDKTGGLLLNVGFAGRINPHLTVGQIVMIDKLLAEGKEPVVLNGDNQELALGFCKKNNLLPAALLTVKNPLTDALLRDKLYQNTSADVVDMEGYDLYMKASKKGLRVISIKVISDNADCDTLQDVKQNGNHCSEVLAQTVFEFLKYLENHKEI